MSRGRAALLILVVIVVVAGVVVVGLRYDATRTEPGSSDVSAAPFVPSSNGGPTAVFIGDSYVSGAGASDLGHRWTSIVAADKLWTEQNIGIGSTGYALAAPDCGAERCGSFQEMAGYAVTLKPPIVVVAGGTNDFTEFVRDPTETVNAIYDTMGTLRTGLPTARIIAVGPSSAGEVPPFVTAYEGVVRDAVNAVGGEFVSLTDPDVIDEDMLDPDGVHVDDRGHAAIADAVEQALK
ncbi:SGNH/GDSL hydrolase family protein [Rhodococcus sp. 05-339-2]|jgi:lysophospholipase L1-like esterase|uniref:SGNH/GDSL hydrolase family protein n=1 Tax=Nocardiaceae TaxID=85025 RepID=UPI00050C30C4|nr:MULTISPECIES: SGNH/GDSL hydrolase family protein [Rhodococcus]AJW41049.1 exported protein [Rhodococcus sp. B7740]OZD85764.1 SGNH/GDSL hydrolase family protein [Rhodococcus sp. 05-339-2]